MANQIDHEIVVLIVAYRRYESLQTLIDESFLHKAARIYINIDGAKCEGSLGDVQACRAVAMAAKERFPDQVFVRFSERNLGSAVSLLSSCDWVFEKEKYAIILEDDCQPNSSFFDFCVSAAPSLDIEKNGIATLCGTRLFPSSSDAQLSVSALSRYFMSWGWATTSENWQAIRSEIIGISSRKLKVGSLSNSEVFFWKSGARRSFHGYLDAWDILFSVIFLKNHWLVVVPGHNLIRNIGNDNVATHTSGEQLWTNFQVVSPSSHEIVLKEDSAMDDWLRRRVFKISPRHLITTRFTALLDYLFRSRRKRLPLLYRWPTST